jgi:uncharacterized protein YggT (Ycf19 family)
VAGVAHGLLFALRCYEFLVFVWAVGSWIPGIRYQSWYRPISDIVQPYVALFRTLGLVYNNIDFTPMVAVLFLEFVAFLISFALGGQS